MLEILGILMILFAFSRHRSGFSSCEIPSWTPLYVISEDDKLNIYINGFDTGIKGSGLIYINPKSSELKVQYCRSNFLVADQHVAINGQASFVFAPLSGCSAKPVRVDSGVHR